MGRSTTAAVSVVVLIAAMAVTVPAGSAAQHRAVRAGCLGGPDFNGDGCGDLLVGDPGATVNGLAGAGRVNVVYGNRDGTGLRTTLLTQGQAGVGDTAEGGDRFGSVVQTTRVDGDDHADLIVGVPGESVGAAEDAGIIQVIYGSAGGLGAGRPGLVLRQGVSGIAGGPEAGDLFGAAVRASATSREEGPAPLVSFGAPGEDIGTTADAGLAGVVLFDRETGGVAFTKSIDQNSPGISGGVEAGDRFGQSVDVFQGPAENGCPVSGTQGFAMIVGVPGEDFGGFRDAGMAHVVRDMTGDTLLSQNEPGVDGTAEAGDLFGTALAVKSFCEHDGPTHVQLVVGTPGEDLGTVADAGMAHYFVADEGQLPLPPRWGVHQDSPGVADQGEASDRFGSVLGFGGAWRGDGIGQSLVVGVPGEDIGAAADGGVVHAFGEIAAQPGTGSLFLTSGNVGRPPATGGNFGTSVMAQHEYLFVGAPGDTGGVVLGIPWETTTLPLHLIPGQNGVPAGAARFGTSLG